LYDPDAPVCIDYADALADALADQGFDASTQWNYLRDVDLDAGPPVPPVPETPWWPHATVDVYWTEPSTGTRTPIENFDPYWRPPW
jgi:hypothetical protein